MNKVDRIRYKEYIKCADECPANRVYPLSIATGTQDGDIYVDGKGCVLFWHPIWHTRCVRKSYGRAEDLFGPMQKQIQVLRKRLSAPDLSQSE